jgi:hypothetical protein
VAQHQFGIRLHHGDRRPQFVRGIGDKAALRVEGRADWDERPARYPKAATAASSTPATRRYL